MKLFLFLERSKKAPANNLGEAELDKTGKDDLPVDNPQKEKWAGLDSNHRRLTPTGLQPVAVKSQASKKQELTTPDKHSVQTSVQMKYRNGTQEAENQALKYPDDLAEIVAVKYTNTHLPDLSARAFSQKNPFFRDRIQCPIEKLFSRSITFW